MSKPLPKINSTTAAAKAKLPDPPDVAIVDLIKAGKIEVKASGRDINSVHVQVRRKVAESVAVRVPVGTFFVAERTSAQNMVALFSSRIVLHDDDWLQETVAVACANRTRDIPHDADRFTVRAGPESADLAKLVELLDAERPDRAVRQAAVWIVTDNANYDDLGILRDSGGRLIDADSAARAMQFCRKAGVAMEKKLIWRDRERLANSVRDAELKAWLHRPDAGN